MEFKDFSRTFPKIQGLFKTEQTLDNDNKHVVTWWWDLSFQHCRTCREAHTKIIIKVIIMIIMRRMMMMNDVDKDDDGWWWWWYVMMPTFFQTLVFVKWILATPTESSIQNYTPKLKSLIPCIVFLVIFCKHDRRIISRWNRVRLKVIQYIIITLLCKIIKIFVLLLSGTVPGQGKVLQCSFLYSVHFGTDRKKKTTITLFLKNLWYLNSVLFL